MRFFRHKTFDTLPALTLRGGHLRWSLRRVVQAWMFGVVWLVLVTGSQLTIFANMLGFTEFEFGLMGALPFLATLGQLPATMLIEKTGLRKYHFILFASIHRLCWIAIGAIPFVLPVPGRAAVWALLVLTFISWFANSIAAPAWWGWMGDLIPKRLRGRYMAQRNRIGQMIQIPSILIISIVTNAAIDGGRPYTVADQPAMLIWVLSGLFCLAGIMGLLDILWFLSIREILPSHNDEPAKAERQPAATARTSRLAWVGQVVEIFRIPLANSRFRYVVGYMMVMTFGSAMTSSYYWRNMLQNLHFSPLTANALCLILGPMVAMLAAKTIGRWTDRWGHRPVLIVGTGLTIVSWIPFLLASPHLGNPGWMIDGINTLARGWGVLVGDPNLQWATAQTPVTSVGLLFLQVALGTVGWTAIGLCQSSYILSFSELPSRSKYIAASCVLISTGGVLGGLSGGVIAQCLEFMQDAPIRLGPFLWNNWHVVFFTSFVCQLVAIAVVARMPDDKDTPVRQITQQFRTNMYSLLSMRLFYRWRLRGWPGVEPQDPTQIDPTEPPKEDQAAQ